MFDEIADFEQVRALMKRFSYKPNFDLNLEPCLPDFGLGLGILKPTMYVLDSGRRHPPVQHDYQERAFWETGRVFIERTCQQALNLIPVHGFRYIPHGLNEQLFKGWLRSVLAEMENHEIDEWLQFDGVPINDPHAVSKPRQTAPPGQIIRNHGA